MDPEKQQKLDLVIHDYLLKKNMKTTADIFAQEANVQPSLSPSAGAQFLEDWWAILWETYASRLFKLTGTLAPNAPVKRSSGGGAVAQSAPAESSRGGGSVAKKDAGSMLPPLPPKSKQMGDEQFNYECVTKAVLKDLPTATLIELASNSQFQLVRDLAAQMLREQAPAAGTSSQKPDMGST